VNSLLNWLDDRTGYRHLMRETLDENVPSGARFRYITGSMLVFAFVTQAVTGIFLWMAYAPSSQTAYESVWWIQFQMTGGWLVRGIHHFMAQAMVVVMGLHLLQIVWDGAYRKPREINHWLGLVLMMLVMGLGLTGYLLPWDQKGYWATGVATNLATLAPVAGKETQLLAVGGGEYGHHTLTRFFALHAGILPALLMVFLMMHIAAFRKHGITAHITPGRADEKFWPKQVLYDAIGCLVLLAVVILCTAHFDVWGLLSGNLPIEHRGAELGAPADPSKQYSAARPEWYFLFLFQLLKYFPGTSEVIGAIVIPGVAMALLFLMPLIGRFQVGHYFNRAVIVGLLLAAGVLTMLALREDYFAPLADQFKLDKSQRDQFKKEISNSKAFIQARHAAEQEAQRMHELINRRMVNPDGTLSEPLFIQKQGAVYLLRNDPLTQGRALFEQKCYSCHDYRDPENSFTHAADEETEEEHPQEAKKFVAPDLYGFGSRKWLANFFDPQKIDSPQFFGHTKHKEGEMVQWLKDEGANISEAQWHAITAALSAQAELPAQRVLDKQDPELLAKGVKLIGEKCIDCHKFGEAGDLGTAPDLTGYGSYEWMLGFLSDPAHERFYRDTNDAMPAFAEDLNQPAAHKVSVRELSLIVDWLRGEYYRATDESPVLPHDEETARRTVIESRMLSIPKRKIIGQ
jgi:quinol-cytochrome oxidoreductase complex cytochrome b subunit/mono/diheme cytochrome c family protein